MPTLGARQRAGTLNEDDLPSPFTEIVAVFRFDFCVSNGTFTCEQLRNANLAFIGRNFVED